MSANEIFDAGIIPGFLFFEQKTTKRRVGFSSSNSSLTNFCHFSLGKSPSFLLVFTLLFPLICENESKKI